MVEPDEPRTLRFAMPPSLGPDKLVASTSSVRSFLERALGRAVDVTVSQSYDVLLRNLLSGAVDAAHAPPFVCAQAEPQGISVVARVVRRGRATYGAALLGKKGAATTLAPGKRRRAGWVDRHSVAGHLLPIAHLRKLGLSPERVFVEQRFLGSYQEALQALLGGEVDVASVHCLGGDARSSLEIVDHFVPGGASSVEVLAITEEVPGDAIVAREPAHGAALAEAFLRLHADVEGGALLDEVFQADRFEPAPAMAYRALYHVAPREP